MTYSCRMYTSITFLAAIGVAVLVVVTSELRTPYSSDGAIYVEVARNLLEGNGLYHTPWGLEPIDQDAVILRYFAPGYPLLIAAISALGPDVKLVALAISVVSWILLAPVLFYALRPLTGDGPAFVIALLACLSPGHFATGTRIYADTLFFLLVAASLGVLFRGVGKEMSGRLILVSGVLASLSYAVRFSGISLLVSVPAGFVGAALLGLLNFKAAVRGGVYWVAGALPIYLALFYLALYLKSVN